MRKGTLHEAPNANEIVSLHEIYEFGIQFLYFDGVISYGLKKRYVQKVPFEILSIGGYEEPSRPTIGSDIWIQSIPAQRSGIWYRLKTPASEYKRYHDPFIWVADLAKHVVDFLHIHHRVSLIHFRQFFYDWLQDTYHSDQTVCRWLSQYGDQDFRRLLATHANFLYLQAAQVDTEYEKHPLWEEIHSKILRSIPEQLENITDQAMFAIFKKRDGVASRRLTTVTPCTYLSEQFLFTQCWTVGCETCFRIEGITSLIYALSVLVSWLAGANIGFCQMCINVLKACRGQRCFTVKQPPAFTVKRKHAKITPDSGRRLKHQLLPIIPTTDPNGQLLLAKT